MTKTIRTFEELQKNIHETRLLTKAFVKTDNQSNKPTQYFFKAELNGDGLYNVGSVEKKGTYLSQKYSPHVKINLEKAIQQLQGLQLQMQRSSEFTEVARDTDYVGRYYQEVAHEKGIRLEPFKTRRSIKKFNI